MSGRRARSALAALLLPLALGVGPSVRAQDDEVPVELGGPSQDAVPRDGVSVTDGAITTDSTAGDGAIEARLRDIFGALETLSGVDVAVTAGVVTLTGTVPDDAAAERAGVLATKTEGVVAVENDLTKDVTVSGRLNPAIERARELRRGVLSLLPLLAVAAVILLVAWGIGALLARQKWLWRRLGRNELIASLLARVVPLVFLILGLVVALNLLDAVAVLSAVLGAAGVLGLAVGFAIRDTIENFIASVMLSIRQPFRPKDFVDIDGREGAVVRLNSRATILMTPDGNHLRIPNAQVFKAVITNYTRNPERRFTYQLGVDANDDPLAAIGTGLATLRGLPFVLDDPAPQAWIDEVGDSNIVLTFAPWIDQDHTDFLKAKSAAISAVKTALEEAGFSLPEPIYRVRMDQGAPTPGEAPAGPRQPRPPRAAKTSDTSVDPALERKVEEDRRVSGADDLLSAHAPTEYDS
ncbi:mechanosensitive ion channel family protein [Parvularcula dongshanensis]|uniref:Small-conductance mechanosensitive channel n=1 Tax=Parvularcula dongshanensis TaxID=1173995 RepID=A0A840I1W0_9PROT|nr:mechanosensitive ion channel family protein [Parvularcula dongshanensis]MBB4658178.1 small-conductance mechanosensitive channel [Parvularcula dongshanensis]